MIFNSDCGWMQDKKSKRLYFYLPAEALQDEDLLEDCLNLLADLSPISDAEGEQTH